MSTYQTEDTIAAIASTVGQAARMIVRMSGAQAREMSSQIADPGHDDAQLCRLRFSGLQCASWIYTFHAPHSYTGEDVIEFHIPGNPLLARMLLDELIRLGARRANPGEFTARAYFNGRLDLAQAEGVASIIAANSETELRAARQLLAGELARRVKPAMDLLAETLGLVEVGIDFSEEDVEFLSSGQIQSRLSEIDTLLGDLLRDSARIERLHHTPQFVLVGRPNAGKSTLLNALAGEERAVVSPQAGTTRDALSAEVALARGMIRLIDVAGIEEKSAENGIEQQMRRRALSTVETADKVILVKDSADDGAPPPTVRAPDLIVLSKSDLRRMDGLCVSARTGDNLKELRRRLDQLAFGTSTTNTLAINARHTQAIQDAREAILRARQQVSGVELLASDLRDALDALGEILGQITPDDVLGRIFSTFCIGK